MSIPFFIINNYIAKNTMKSCLPWFLVCPFFNKFDKNVSTKMCPNRALHNLVTYCGRAKANFCRCFVDFDIEKFVQQKSASSYFAFFLHFLTRAFFSRMGPKHFCSGGVGPSTSWTIQIPLSKSSENRFLSNLKLVKITLSEVQKFQLKFLFHRSFINLLSWRYTQKWAL